MGRGRAKAKQTKVARELKYSAPGMDLSRLQRDLHSDDPFAATHWDNDTSDSDDGDAYPQYADEEDDESTADSAAS
jgi:hypothetical protein